MPRMVLDKEILKVRNYDGLSYKKELSSTDHFPKKLYILQYKKV